MVDASALMALFDPDDQYHRQAITFRDIFLLPFDIQLFTTDYVYSEAMSHLTHLSLDVLEQLDAIIRKPHSDDPLKIKILWVNDVILDKALPIYFKYIRQDFSITNCTSFVLMKENNIETAFTFAKPFKIYSYRKGYDHRKRGFWKLPEMLKEYLTTQR